MRSIIETVLTELGLFFRPLSAPLSGRHAFAALLRRFGFDVKAEDLGPVETEPTLAALRSGILALRTMTEDAASNGIDGSELLALAEAVKPLFSKFSDIPASLDDLLDSASSVADEADELPGELIDLLLAEYLAARSPLLLQILKVLGAYDPAQVPAGDRGLPYTRHHFRWGRIEAFIDDSEGWARDVYGWGVAFDSDEAISRIVRLFALLGGGAAFRTMTDTEIAAFQPHLAGSAVRPWAALAPIATQRAVNSLGHLEPEPLGDIGLGLFPAGGALESEKGLAVAPYSRGALAAQTTIGPGWDLHVAGAIGAVGGAVFTFEPKGAALQLGVGTPEFSGTFSVDLSIGDPAGGKLVFIGESGSSRVEADAVTLSLGGRASNSDKDFYIAAGVRALGAVIDASGDGLLGSLLKGPATLSIGDLVVGWRFGRGVYFEGGTSIGVTIPLDVKIGPVRIKQLGLAIDLTPAPAVALTVSGDLTIGPIFAAAQGLGVRTSVVPVAAGSGILGKYDLRFGFIPPTGYALAINAPPLKGGGLISVNGTEYRGALALQIEAVGFSAFAILNTRLPGGKPGFSLAASLFGTFSLPLGHGFFLTGLGGIVGINRTVDTEALRNVMYAGRLDNLLFPADPIANAARILNDMAAILPSLEGQHVFGPVAKISWGQPPLLDIKLGVVIEVGNHVRILILGGLSSSLPTKDAALVVLSLSFMGEINFAKRTISFDASLESSRILSWPVSGDAAIRTGWGVHPDLVAAFGGLHPQYPRPPNFPELRRISINFGTNNPKLTLTGYAAVTVNSLQFGARADLYAQGPRIRFIGRVAAEGHIYLDALVYFNPFAFDVRVGGGLSLLVDGDVVAGLGFNLWLTGPNTFHIRGRVWVTICRIDVGFRINHSWGESQTLPSATVDGAAELRNALLSAKAFEPVAPANRAPGVAFRLTDDVTAAIDPVGGVRLVQRAVPLGVTIDKIGEAQLTGARTFDVRVAAATSATAVQPVHLDFVRGHFFSLSEAERLRIPAFESHRAGFVFAPDILSCDPTQAVVDHYDYEIVKLPGGQDRSAPADVVKHGSLAADFATRFMTAYHERYARSVDKLLLKPPNEISIAPVGFMPIAAGGAALDAVVSGADASHFTGTISQVRRNVEATPALELEAANPILAAYIASAEFAEAA